jgi:hypothetical protein
VQQFEMKFMLAAELQAGAMGLDAALLAALPTAKFFNVPHHHTPHLYLMFVHGGEGDELAAYVAICPDAVLYAALPTVTSFNAPHHLTAHLYA